MKINSIKKYYLNDKKGFCKCVCDFIHEFSIDEFILDNPNKSAVSNYLVDPDVTKSILCACGRMILIQTEILFKNRIIGQISQTEEFIIKMILERGALSVNEVKDILENDHGINISEISVKSSLYFLKNIKKLKTKINPHVKPYLKFDIQ